MFLKALALVFMFLIRLIFPQNLSLIEVNGYDRAVVNLVHRYEKLDFEHQKAAF